MKKNKTKRLVLMAMFVAIMVVLELCGVGVISIPGGINAQTAGIVAIIGTLCMGMKPGLLFGFVFGSISFFKAYHGLSAIAAPLMANNILWVIALCYIPRLLIPVTTHFMYRLLKGRAKNPMAVMASALTGSLTNTVFYLGLCYLFYCLVGLDKTAVLALISVNGLINAGIEAAVTAVIAPPVVIALQKNAKFD